MYGYYEYTDLTPQQVLQKVSQKQIFEWLLGEKVEEGKHYRSPVRKDKRPGCRIDTLENGDMLFMDYGDTTTHRSCFRLAMDLYCASLQSVITMICDEFGLSTNVGDYSRIQLPISFESNEVTTRRTEIHYQKRPFKIQDKRYWNPYSISEEDLASDIVNPASIVTIHNYKRDRKVTFRPRNVCYAIHVADAVKLYQPHNTDYKFITNCTIDHVGNISNVTNGDRLIIAKAYKDHRILRNFGRTSTIWLPSELIIPSPAILRDLCVRFREIIIFFDNDVVGMESAVKLMARFNSMAWEIARIVYIPIKYGHKDLAEFKFKEGKQDTIHLLNQLKL